MRFLVLGAGAIGGYFGGRLLEAGRDVTFLVRPERAAGSRRPGWRSRARPATPLSRRRRPSWHPTLRDAFDVVILTCKAYDLDAAIESVAPAVGPATAVVPLLNGMRHLDALDGRFGPSRVLGGTCFISARIDDAGRVVHVSDVHRLAFGERSGGRSPRVDAIAAAMAGHFEADASERIVLEMWEKWAFLASLAGITCLTRSAVGDVVAAGGADLAAAILEECRSVAEAAGYSPRPEALRAALGRLTDARSAVTASMLGDVERRGRTEADHILGDLLRRRGGTTDGDRSLLRLAYTAVKASEARTAPSWGRRGRDEGLNPAELREKAWPRMFTHLAALVLLLPPSAADLKPVTVAVVDGETSAPVTAFTYQAWYDAPGVKSPPRATSGPPSRRPPGRSRSRRRPRAG